MQSILPQKLRALAQNLPAPLYVVGGFVRDFLAGLHRKTEKPDLDICAPLCADDLVAVASSQGFSVRSVFRNTGTVKLADSDGVEYEFSSFRSDEYVRGVHTPTAVFFTNDIQKDARRRDFTCNAVYYNIQKGEFADPLLGIPAIREKRLTTVAPAKKVFGEDGLRLMRLCRQAAQLGFTPDSECLQGAKDNAALIADISPERIYSELCAILTAEEKYGVQGGAYKGLSLLSSLGILDVILPELALGRGMEQPAAYHDFDVLEHSLQTVRYAPSHLRLAALLHDIGKPACKQCNGNFHQHHQMGAELAKTALARLKAPKKTIEQVCALTLWHMYDFDCNTSEKKLRRFLVSNAKLLPDLLALKQADYSACKGDLAPAPTCVRWSALTKKMQAEGVPFSLKELAVKGNDLTALVPQHKIADVLHALLMHVAVFPQDNQKQRLLMLANKLIP